MAGERFVQRKGGAGRRPASLSSRRRTSHRIEIGVGDALPVWSNPLPDTQTRREFLGEQLASDHLGGAQPEADDEVRACLGDLEILETNFAQIHFLHQLHGLGATNRAMIGDELASG